MFCHGARVGFYQGDISLLMDDIKTLKPTFFPVVPRLLNRIYDKVSAARQCWTQMENNGCLITLCACRFWARLRLHWREPFFITPWGGNRPSWAVESWGTTACGTDWSSIRYRHVSITLTPSCSYWQIWWKAVELPPCGYMWHEVWAEQNTVSSFIHLSLFLPVGQSGWKPAIHPHCIRSDLSDCPVLPQSHPRLSGESLLITVQYRVLIHTQMCFHVG